MDYMAKAGAEKLCETIEAYWQAQGHPGIRARVEHVMASRIGSLYCVRSNIGTDGYPPPMRDHTRLAQATR